MSQVIVLSWEPATRTLTYVSVNDGAGDKIAEHVVDEAWAPGVTEVLTESAPPRTAELIIEQDGVLIDEVGASPVVRCTVKAVGKPGGRQFELRAKGVRGAIAIVPAAELGVEDAMADTVQTLDYLYSPALTPPGCWLGCEGGIGAWLEKRRLAALDVEEQRRMARRFINPYTFVPFPETLERGEPAWHHMLADDNLSGTIAVTWKFTSPFQAPAGASATTVLRLPGSSVKGAVRSVHEALAGGCLRVFDDDFIPSYRDAPSVRSADWTMAQVTAATNDGQALKVRLCEDVVWVRAAQLRGACGDSLGTGSRVTLHAVPATPNSLGRKELDQDAEISKDGDWVVLVTDKGTRSVKKGTYFLACGRLGKHSAEVTEDAWRAFRLAVTGASDLTPGARVRLGVNPDDQQPTTRVVFGSQRIGRRRVVTGRLWPGDVIWVRTARAAASLSAEELSLAAVWRHPGWDPGQGQKADREEWAARNRVPEELAACSNPGHLCPTCRIFGSADQHARGWDDRAEQHAYAGHVRFGDACSAEPVALKPIQRAPLGAPRPGAGQFYLTYDDRNPAAEGGKPTREWGSGPDSPDQRRLRGRKFYWHADPLRQDPPRHIARQHQQKAKMAVEKLIAPAGTTLTQRISFDNLSEAELGGLIAALDPGRVLSSDGKPLLLHLGGGKPLGLGSCSAAVTELRTWDADSRYGGAPEAAPDEDAYVRAFREACPAELTSTWPSLAAVLAEGSVDPARVWYPPGSYWAHQSLDEKAFDEPFAFFTASSGMFLATGGDQLRKRELIPLPPPDAERQEPADHARRRREMTGQRMYVDVGAARIQHYISRTPRLKGQRGASAWLSWATDARPVRRRGPGRAPAAEHCLAWSRTRRRARPTGSFRCVFRLAPTRSRSRRNWPAICAQRCPPSSSPRSGGPGIPTWRHTATI